MTVSLLIIAIISIGSQSTLASKLKPSPMTWSSQELVLKNQLDKKIDGYLVDYMREFDREIENYIDARINALRYNE